MNKKTALIFFGIIVIGGGISFYTLKNRERLQPLHTGGNSPVVETGVPVKTEPKPAGKPTEVTAEPAPKAAAPQESDTPAASVAVGVFKSAEAAMTAIAQKIGEKDFAGLLEIVGPEAIAGPIKEQVKSFIESSNRVLDPKKPFIEISKSADSVRWALNFVPEAGNLTAPQMYADLTEVGENTLDITKISFPIEINLSRSAEVPGASAAPPGSESATSPLVPGMTPEQNADALTVAHAFSKAVIQRNFNTARELSDPSTVTDERVAALMIAVEEGKFTLKEERPLVVTLSRDDITWVLTRIQSEEMASEFALELGQIDRSWKVNGLTFSKVLSALSEAAGAGDVAYSPIVDDPSGGDSLVLYFEFDDSGLTPRTSRQLAIVADILNQGKDRVIRINGHADALGSDDYNIGLSDKRAESIRQALVSRGVKPDQVITEAFGATKPRRPNFLPDGSDNPGGRSQNRRAEVLLDF